MRPDASFSRYRDSARNGSRPSSLGGPLDRLFERQVFECVQRVVVNEDADRPLRRQQMRELIDHVRQRMVRGTGVGVHRGP